MASLMEELIQTLDAEEKCYSQLIPIEEGEDEGDYCK